MIKASLKIGCVAVQVEFQKVTDLHKFCSMYASIPRKCDHCGSEDIYPSFKSPQGNDYFMIECAKCGASANFGIHKNGGGLFWKKEPMQIFQKQNSQSNVQQTGIKNIPVDTSFDMPAQGEDVPF